MMETTIVTTLNLSKICRVCLTNSEEMLSIFSQIDGEDNLEDDPSYVYEMLMSISTMRINNEDGLPTKICSNCMEVAHSSYRFQQQCNRSQLILETYVAQLPVKNKQSEDNTSEDNEFLDYFDSTTISSNVESTSENHNIENSESCEVVVEEENYSQSEDETEMCEDMKSEILMNNGDKLSKVEIFKVEVKEEPLLDAVKIASSEDNLKLRERLAMKRRQSNGNVNSSSNENMKKKQVPLTGFNYYLRVSENGEKMYACNICEKTYKHASSLKIHIRSHTLERPYVCSLCGKDFKQYGALTYHMRSHTGEQPYACKICGKRYKQSGTLTAHLRVHTGQKPFLCSVCGRGFRQAPDLGYHMRTHTKEKPYMCNVCGKTMRMQCHLVQHMRTHTGERPFKCTECNKAFPSSTRLKRHAIIHTDLKPYTCDVCEKSFNRSSSLRVHAKIHTDERPHVCSICGKGFIQAHALRAHIFTHSSTESNV